jgi:hypothetical protein
MTDQEVRLQLLSALLRWDGLNHRSYRDRLELLEGFKDWVLTGKSPFPPLGAEQQAPSKEELRVL